MIISNERIEEKQIEMTDKEVKRADKGKFL